MVWPARRNRAGAHRVFQGQVPANDPREELAQRSVGVSVGAAGERDHGRKFRVAEPRKGASQPGKHEGEHESRPRVMRPQTWKNKDARADNRTDA